MQKFPSDAAPLRETPTVPAARVWWPGWWMLAFLMLVVGAVVALVLYLQHFESEEETRRQAADAQWLEQSVQFHFRRLEEDLRVAARQPDDVQGGVLWRAPAVLLAQGWVGAPQAQAPARGQRDFTAQVDTAQARRPLDAPARGLRRSAYAGPMRDAAGALTDQVWLAVPYFERGRFVGNYVAAVSLDTAVHTLVPDWFAQTHGVHLVLDEGTTRWAPEPVRPFRAALNLAGTEVYLEVTPTQEQPATVPRLFLLVAMLFLGGMLVSLWALRRDIHKRQQVQAMALAQQERLEATGRLVAVGEVASTLAHELNQPLGALSSFATGLLNKLQAGRITPEDTVPVVQRMAVLAEKAGRIIQRVNAIARRREISLQRLDLVPVLQRMAPHALPDTAPVWVEADELLVEHLLNNLLSNAQDAAQAHADAPQVAVELDVAEGWAYVRVADNGPGVPEENQAHIFDAFYSSKEGGMGMGLAICRSIVDAHHGRIQVDRSPVLGGARFTVSLPVAGNALNAPASPGGTINSP